MELTKLHKIPRLLRLISFSFRFGRNKSAALAMKVKPKPETAEAAAADDKKKEPPKNKEEECPPQPEKDPEDIDETKPKKISLWKALFGTDKEDVKPPQPGPDTCPPDKEDPDLSYLEGKAYKTCGTAFVVQKDRLPEVESDIDRCEDLIVKEMEAEPELKQYVIDPMPPFRNVEQRMIDLDARRLHPLYRKYQSYVPKPTPKRAAAQPQEEYKSRSGPIPAEKLPQRLKLNAELLEKKNIYADFKRVDPPRYLVGKLVEMKMNEKKPLQRRYPSLEQPKRPKRESVHETLRQEEALTC